MCSARHSSVSSSFSETAGLHSASTNSRATWDTFADMKPEEWIVGPDTGRSSKTIWAVMMGVIVTPQQCDSQYCTPSDPSDFGRCYRMLTLIPEWQPRLSEVSKMFPAWSPFIREWEKMKSLYQTEWDSGSCPKLYEFMKTLCDESRICDGWKQTGNGCWERGDSMSVSLGNGITISTP